jgi:hypothetical protein
MSTAEPKKGKKQVTFKQGEKWVYANGEWNRNPTFPPATTPATNVKPPQPS